MSTAPVLPPMLARMPVPGPVCVFAGDCGAPAVAEVIELRVDAFVAGYCEHGASEAEARESLARNLLDPGSKLWRPLCGEHRGYIRDHFGRVGVMLIERLVTEAGR